MAKKALINFFSNGVSFEQGKIYSDEVTENLDSSNFEEVSEVVDSIPSAGVVGDENTPEVTPELDTDVSQETTTEVAPSTEETTTE